MKFPWLAFEAITLSVPRHLERDTPPPNHYPRITCFSRVTTVTEMHGHDIQNHELVLSQQDGANDLDG
jgi:hypothetical protein